MQPLALGMPHTALGSCSWRAPKSQVLNSLTSYLGLFPGHFGACLFSQRWEGPCFLVASGLCGQRKAISRLWNCGLASLQEVCQGLSPGLPQRGRIFESLRPPCRGELCFPALGSVLPFKSEQWLVDGGHS